MGYRNWVAFAAAAAAAMPCCSAEARSWPTTAGWEVFEGDDYCGLGLDYEGKGETRLTVAKNLDGSALMIVTNYGWSAKKGEKYDLDFYVGMTKFSGGTSIGTGESYERKGFATKFDSSFLPAFAGASSFKVYMGETLVDSLRLQGSGAALHVVDQCVSSIRAVKAAQERERQRFAHIPDDPFAAAKGSPPATSVASTARGDAAGWVTTDDYPSDALSAEAEGRVSVKYVINATGRIENCTVIASSGNASLDRATCSNLTRRGRYTPAVGADGSPIASTNEFSFEWKLPQ